MIYSWDIYFFATQIINLLDCIESYSTLDGCQIEGMEPMVAKYQHIYSSVKKKPYDILDHRKLDFDVDFEEFKRQMADLEVKKQHQI